MDAVARLVSNVLAGTVFQKMSIGKDLPLIKHVRLKRQLKQPNRFNPRFCYRRDGGNHHLYSLHEITQQVKLNDRYRGKKDSSKDGSLPCLT